MYTPARSQRFTPNSLSPSDSTPHTTPASEYSQSSHGSPSDANIDRPGSTTSQVAEHPPLFDPYYRQYHGPGINTGTHLSHHSAPVSCHAQPYPSSIDTTYNWQGDGAGSGYRALYSPQTRPGWSGGSSVDQSTDSSRLVRRVFCGSIHRVVACVHSTDYGRDEGSGRARNKPM